MTDFSTNIHPIEHLFAPLDGRHLLDIGCGRGRLSRALVRRGATVTGVDPQEAMLDLARAAAPEASFVRTGGESLPFEDGRFDGAVILNSLHHVPAAAIDDCLAEAMRVIRADGAFLILEPLARGGYQEVFSPIEDETEVRAMALEKVDAYIARTGAVQVFRVEYETLVPEESAESVLASSLKVDPTRAAVIERNRAEVARRFAEQVRQTERGPALDQPMVAIALRKP